MKKLFTFFLLMALCAFHAFSQSIHTISFETSEDGAGWSWTMAENADNPSLEFLANPVSGGINTSATVAKFTARSGDAGGMNWALCHTNGDGEFTFDATNSTVKIMVYKPTISNVGIKFEGMSPAIELKVANTVTNQWEELTFDFSGSIGSTYNKIVIIPDFVEPYGDGTDRVSENVIYMDNIQVPDGVVTGPLPEPTTGAPVPDEDEANVLSIYSDSYSNLTGTNYNPGWGQSTAVTVDHSVDGNNTLLYEGLNYQGTEYTHQDVSGYDFLHVDFWTPNSTGLQFFLISADPTAETLYELPITTETWVSVDIPLSNFAPPVDLSNVFQFKVVGNGTVYFDNIYFGRNRVTAVSTFDQKTTELYPNPVTDILNISSASKVSSIQVLNLVGQAEEFVFVSENSIDLSDLQAGYYIVSVTLEDGTKTTQKVVKL